MYTCSGVLAILFVTEKNPDIVSERIKELHDGVIKKIQTELKIKIILHAIDETHKNDFFVNKNGMQMNFKLTPGKVPSKGLVISAEMECLRESVDKPRYFVYCDGTRRIDFNDIYKVFYNLHSDNHDCVITKRIPWRGAIPETRKRIEEFESWLVCTQFGLTKTYDLQSGLWGYNRERCKITIYSEGYELELNFAIEAFRYSSNNIAEIEIQVDTSPRTTSSAFVESYSESSFHFQKASFLSHYFILSRSQFIKALNAYHSSRGAEFTLPSEYVAMLNKLDEPPQPPVIVSA